MLESNKHLFRIDDQVPWIWVPNNSSALSMQVNELVHGNSALHLALMHHHTVIVKYLLTNHADPNQKDEQGNAT